MVMSMMKIRWSLTLAGRYGVLLDEYAGRADDDDDDNDDDDRDDDSNDDDSNDDCSH